MKAYGIFLHGEDPADLAACVEALGLGFNLIEAVDGRYDPSLLADPRIDGRAASARLGYPLRGGQAGCALSHLKAYGMFLETGDPWALVMEADAEISPEASAVFSISQEWDSSEARVLLLASRNQGFAEPGSAVQITGALTVYECRYVPRGTTAYLISRAAAQKATTSLIDYAADWPSWASSVRFSCVDPVVARERSRVTTVGEEAPPSRTSAVRSLLWLRYWGERPAYLGPAEYLYREWLPRVEEALWRRLGSPTMSRSDQAPLRPSRWARPISALCKARISFRWEANNG